MNNEYLQINKLWWSNDERMWKYALDLYWTSGLVKNNNVILEKEFDNLNPLLIRNLNTEEFFNWLYYKYFVWKYTAPNRLVTTRRNLLRYKEENKMCELERIHNILFEFDCNDIEYGLKISSSIYGLGIAGASGLLAVLYPDFFGTVDQFVVKGLSSIDRFPLRERIIKMKPEGLTIKDGIILIEIMRNKADYLNELFVSEQWTPRSIDKIIWTLRD